MMNLCPFAVQAASPNYTPGRNGHPIKAGVMHIAQGNAVNSIAWLRNPASQASSHFFIDFDGTITQLVGILDTAWGNGLRYTNGIWINPQDHQVHPAWSLIEANVNPNDTTVSVEHAGNSGVAWTAAMAQSNARLLCWLGDQTGLVWAHGTTLIGHSDIDNVDRPDCPGPAVDWNGTVQAANDPDLHAWGTDSAYNATWRIPTCWRNAGRPGKATCDPFVDRAGATWQTFERGVVRFHPTTGAVAYLPKGS